MIGTLLADFHRGAIGPGLPQPIASAIALHRAVDGRTDRHPAIARARSLFAPPHRRYSGVALDLYFDHCLAHDWTRHAPAIGFDAFVATTYGHLQTGIDTGDLPAETHRFAQAMIDGDWLRDYMRFDGVERALGRLNHAIRRRFAREVDLRPLAGELLRLQPALDDAFDVLFPDLIAFVAENAASGGPR